MKKITAFFAAAAAAVCCLTSCSVPLKTTSVRSNGLNCPFTSKVSVSLDKLKAEGTLDRIGEGVWEVEFSAPNTLSGVKLSFSEGNVDASYKGLGFSVPQSALPVKAMLLNLIKAVDENARSEELKGEEKDGLLEISGKLDGGDYTITVDKDGRLCGFDMPNNSLKMLFTELSVGSAGVPAETAPTTSTTSVTSAAETTTSSTAPPKQEKV